MARAVPGDLQAKAEVQLGVLTRRQLLDAGLTDEHVESQISAGRWRRVHPGVYATFSGQLSRSAVIWAALLYAGSGATASHETAAELWGLLDLPNQTVHVTVPVSRRVASRHGVRIHYANRLPRSRHPARIPPMTRVDDTVLDLVDRSRHVTEVVGWVTRACQRRRTTPDSLRTTLAERKKIRWRAAVQALLVEVSDGAETPLEMAYAQLVERRHGLPAGTRQQHRYTGRARQWQDIAYEAFCLVVELDGRVGHVEEGVFRDYRRDNFSTETGWDTLRYGWSDTLGRSCEVAGQVARVLRRNGWTAPLRPCGPACRAVRAEFP